MGPADTACVSAGLLDAPDRRLGPIDQTSKICANDMPTPYRLREFTYCQIVLIEWVSGMPPESEGGEPGGA